MKVTVLKSFLHDRLGRVLKGDVIDIQDFQARTLAKAGIVSTYATKVVVEEPVIEIEQHEEQQEEEHVKKKLGRRNKKETDSL